MFVLIFTSFCLFFTYKRYDDSSYGDIDVRGYPERTFLLKSDYRPGIKAFSQMRRVKMICAVRKSRRFSGWDGENDEVIRDFRQFSGRDLRISIVVRKSSLLPGQKDNFIVVVRELRRFS